MTFGLGGILLAGVLVGCAWAGHRITSKSPKVGWILPLALLAIILLPLLGLAAETQPDTRGAAIMLAGLMIGFFGPAVVGGLLGATIATVQKARNPADRAVPPKQA